MRTIVDLGRASEATKGASYSDHHDDGPALKKVFQGLTRATTNNPAWITPAANSLVDHQ